MKKLLSKTNTRILQRAITGLLIFSMLFEASCIDILASQPDIIVKEDTDTQTETTAEPENTNFDTDGDVGGSADSSGSDTTYGNSNSDGSLADTDNEVEQSDDNVAVSSEDITNTDDGSVSDNNIAEPSDSMNSDDIASAEKAFEDMVSSKDVMALIYLTDAYDVHSAADKNSSIIASLESGHTVYLRSVTITQDNIWFKAAFWTGDVLKEGYIEQKYLAYSDEDWLNWDATYLRKLADNNIINKFNAGGMTVYTSSYEDVGKFPAGYQAALTKLKAAHPNWVFVPLNTKLNFETAVNSEMGDRSLIQKTDSNVSKGWVGESCPTTSGWYYASKDAVAYYMDPRNFLTESYIFQFEQLTFNSSYHTVDAIQNFLNSTFMKGAIPDDEKNRTYAQAFYEIGSSRKLSPIHLASRVYQEQGKGTSGLISGTYPGYEGFYNYFNVSANGGTTEAVIKSGLEYAKKQGWNTRYKSLEGGAATIGNNYILKGQDTPYLQKFNVDSGSPYGLYNHQYMQNIQAPASESTSTKKMYEGAGSLNSAFVFKIPVYANMSGLKLNKSALQLNKNETFQLTASVNGTDIDGDKVTWKSSDEKIVTVVSGLVTAVDSGTASVTASYDEQEVICRVTVSNPLINISLDKESMTLRRPDTVVDDTNNLDEEALSSNISTAALTVIYEPEDTTDDKTITWTSSNKKVATVDKNGVITAVNAGETTITAKASKAGGLTAKCKVTVIAPVYKIEFSSENNPDTILTGQRLNLYAEYFPKDTTSDTTVLWKSSDTSVINVAQKTGSILGVSAGSAEITATIGGYSASHKVTVENCTVTFMDKDNKTPVKTLTVSYAQAIKEEDFPDENTNTPGFIGWYTGPDGTGKAFEYNTHIYQKETIVYPYFAKPGQGFYTIPIGDQTYTGSAIKPEITVYDINTGSQPSPLIKNKDYTVSYKNNKKAASSDSANPPTVIIKGRGNYEGAQTITFNIVPKALTDADITYDNITSAHTGKSIKGSPAIYRNGKKLIKNTDYKLTYPQTDRGAYRNKGTYSIIVTGCNGYSGTVTVYETITDKIPLSKVKIAKIPTQAYDPDKIDTAAGKGIEPETPLTVTYKGKTLIQSTDGGASGDYVVSYKNNFKTGTASAIITAADNDETLYSGSKSITYKIAAVSINKASISGVLPKTYNGAVSDVLQENISVTLNGVTLTPSPDDGRTGDYVLEYKRTDRAGSATVIVKGINKYTGTKKKTYKITAFDLSSLNGKNITIEYRAEDSASDILTADRLEDITTPYVKGGARPVISSIKYTRQNEPANGSDPAVYLIADRDFTVKYKNNDQITSTGTSENKLPTITITGKGLYKGKLSGSFKITPAPLSDAGAKVTMTASDVVYKQKKGSFKTKISLTDINGKKLQAGKDYDKALKYTYVDDTDAEIVGGGHITRSAGEAVGEDDIPSTGTAIRVTAYGMGPYKGNGENETAFRSAVYRIVAADISKAKVKVDTMTYNSGNAVTLSENDISVTLNGAKLVLGNDYIIDEDTYSGNCSKGKATVIIRGCAANCGGSKKISFKIKGKLFSW